MNLALESTKKFLVPALIGAAITYGTLTVTSKDRVQRQQIALLETRVEGLEALLTQKEAALKTASPYGTYGMNSVGQNTKTANKPASTTAIANNQQAEALDHNMEEMVASIPDNDQALKDLMTLFVGDPRSFSEKVNDFITSNPSPESIAIASTSVFNLAENSDVLPDHSLQSIYLDQTDPDLRRVVAQVASLRGDNSLIEMKITETQTNLKSTNPIERQKALVELAKTRYAGATKMIAPMLQDNDIGVKLDALLALRATGNQSHIRLVEDMTNDPNPSISWLAKDVISTLQNLSDTARTKLVSNDIVAELPVIATQ
jgi:hypothetical protein